MAELTCWHCGSEFQGHGLRRHCSEECRKARQYADVREWHRNNRERINARVRERYAQGLIPKKNSKPGSPSARVGGPAGPAGPRATACGHCATPLPETGPWAKYCSKTCRNLAKRAREDPEKRRKREEAYRERHAARIRARISARRKVPYDEEATAYVQILLGDPCCYCGSPCEAIDHIVPVRFGGTSAWVNLTPACHRCNASKGTKSLLDFLAYRAQARMRAAA